MEANKERDIDCYMQQLNKKKNVLRFHTQGAADRRQTFVIKDNSYHNYTISVFDGLDLEYKSFDKCGIVFWKNEDYRIAKSDQDYLAKVTERYGTTYSNAYAQTKYFIDLNSIEIISDRSYEEVISEEIEKRNLFHSEKRKQQYANQEYNKINSNMQSLIEGELIVDSKEVCYGPTALGSKASFESFYVYDSNQGLKKLGLYHVLEALEFYTNHYGFNCNIAELKNNYKLLLGYIREKKYNDLSIATELQKKIATELSNVYCQFLEFCLNNDLNLLDDNLKYNGEWEKNGWGNDRKYTFIVGDLSSEIAVAIVEYTKKVFGQEYANEIEKQFDELFEKMENITNSRR